MANQLLYKIKRTYIIQKGLAGNSSIVADAETDTIVKNYLNKINEIAESTDETNKYFYDNADIEKTALLDHWFTNGVELTILTGEAKDYKKTVYTDGKNKLELSTSDVYRSCFVDNDFGMLDFFDVKNNKYFSCKIADYKKGDEKIAYQECIDKKINKEAIKFTEEQKAERVEAAQQKAEFLGLRKLTGTKKQKDWAETIRSRIIDRLGELSAEKLLTIKYVNSAKFWIDNRFKKLTEFEKFAKEYEQRTNDLFFLKDWGITITQTRNEKVNNLTEMSMDND
jgi:hypothetical protein